MYELILTLISSHCWFSLLKFGERKSKSDLALSLDSKSADKEIKVVTPEKSKACVTAFTEQFGNNLPVNKNQKWSYFP